MKEADYPALFRGAGVLAAEYQRFFFRSVFWHLALLVSAAIISVIDAKTPGAAYAQAVFLFGSLSCAVYLFWQRPDRHWYASRAIAESIKTVTWRFVTRAEPFDCSDDIAESDLSNTLDQIVKQNQDISGRLTDFLDEPQITTGMRALRAAGFDDRLAYYVANRVKEQLTWYARKASHNKRMARRFFFVLFGVNGLAIAVAFLRVRFPDAEFWPTDVLVPLSAALLTWIQAKKFSELSASYALTAHEISIIREQSAWVHSDSQLSHFVRDAENAFSREHTQWAARKDQ